MRDVKREPRKGFRAGCLKSLYFLISRRFSLIFPKISQNLNRWFQIICANMLFIGLNLREIKEHFWNNLISPVWRRWRSYKWLFLWRLCYFDTRQETRANMEKVGFCRLFLQHLLRHHPLICCDLQEVNAIRLIAEIDRIGFPLINTFSARIENQDAGNVFSANPDHSVGRIRDNIYLI